MEQGQSGSPEAGLSSSRERSPHPDGPDCRREECLGSLSSSTNIGQGYRTAKRPKGRMR